MKPTYTTNSPISFPYPSINFNNANREVLRITHEGRIIIGEGLSTEEATQQAAKLLIVSFEEQIQKMVDNRLAAERIKVRVLRDALERRHTEQGYHRQYVDDVLDATKEAGK